MGASLPGDDNVPRASLGTLGREDDDVGDGFFGERGGVQVDSLVTEL